MPQIGEEIPELVKIPSTVAMFRLSAVMWNAHRTHIDHPYASEVEGHKNTLVQDYMLGAYMVEMLTAWAGPGARLERLTYSNRGPVHANTSVRCWGRITDVEEPDDGTLRVSLDIGVNNEAGEICVPGTARIRIPAEDLESLVLKAQ